MRALLISWEYPPVIEGGLARAVRKLSEHLVQDGAEVHVLTRGGGRLPRQEERHGVIVHRVVEPQFPMDVERVRALGRGDERRHDASSVSSSQTGTASTSFTPTTGSSRAPPRTSRATPARRGSSPSTPPSSVATRAGFTSTRSRTSTPPSGRWSAAPIV